MFTVHPTDGGSIAIAAPDGGGWGPLLLWWGWWRGDIAGEVHTMSFFYGGVWVELGPGGEGGGGPLLGVVNYLTLWIGASTDLLRSDYRVFVVHFGRYLVWWVALWAVSVKDRVGTVHAGRIILHPIAADVYLSSCCVVRVPGYRFVLLYVLLCGAHHHCNSQVGNAYAAASRMYSKEYDRWGDHFEANYFRRARRSTCLRFIDLDRVATTVYLVNSGEGGGRVKVREDCFFCFFVVEGDGEDDSVGTGRVVGGAQFTHFVYRPANAV